MCLLLADVREQGELARTLHRDCDLALVAPARAADAPRTDLALLRDVAPELVDVLVVDLVDLRLAEKAGLAAAAAGGRPALPPGGAGGLRGCPSSFPLKGGSSSPPPPKAASGPAAPGRADWV